jgi:hypothetical protein
VDQVYSVAGQYDVVAHARVESNEALADLVTVLLHDQRKSGSPILLVSGRDEGHGVNASAYRPTWCELTLTNHEDSYKP